MTHYTWETKEAGYGVIARGSPSDWARALHYVGAVASGIETAQIKNYTINKYRHPGMRETESEERT
jgi:hypothetical protein